MPRYESACVDGAFLRVTRRVTAVRAPHREEESLRLRSAPSALVLASAMMAAMPEQPARDRRAVLAMLSPLGFREERYRRAMPAVASVPFEGMTARIVRDGAEERAYLCGEPERVLACCRRVWDGRERGITQEDERAAAGCPAGTCAFATAPVREGTIGDMTYLGSVTVDDVPDGEALEELFALWETGFPVSVLADGTPLPPELPVTAEVPAKCLYVPYEEGKDFAAPIRAYLARRKRRRALLPRCAAALTGTLLLSALCGSFLGAVGCPWGNPLTWVFLGLAAALAALGWGAALRPPEIPQ